jgi:type I restriction enzyme S subunit
MTELPESWVQAPLGEVAPKITKGTTPTTNGYAFVDRGVNFIKIENIAQGKIAVDSISQFISEAAHKSQTRSILKEDDILFSIAGSIGITAIVDASHLPANTNQALAIISGISDFFLPKFLKLQLESFVARATTAKARGGAMNNISLGDLREAVVTIPPLPEQHRIVEKIEALFSELDAGQDNLTRAQAQLKLYRQSLLKAAFQGRLTTDWRAANPDKLESPETLLSRIRSERDARYKQALDDWQHALSEWRAGGEVGDRPSKPRRNPDQDPPTTQQREMMVTPPDGWQWLQVADFAFVTKLAGFEYTKYVKYDPSGDLQVIKAENAGPHGFKETDFSLIRSKSVENLTRSFLEGGELLMVFVGAGTGNVGIVPAGRRFFLGPNIGMARIESTAIIPRYVELFLRSPLGCELKLATVKAVAQPSLSMATIRQVPVVIPPTAEQVEIVRTLDAQLEATDQIEIEITTALAKISALRQSILKQAFSGRLVPQDPDDEPASALLARLRDTAPAPRTRRKTPA